MFPEPKYVIFFWFLLHPSFSTKRSGLPDFYSVKLDVIGFTQKPHFWNQGTSYINALCLISHELEGQFLKRLQMNRETELGFTFVISLWLAIDSSECHDWRVLSELSTKYSVFESDTDYWAARLARAGWYFWALSPYLTRKRCTRTSKLLQTLGLGCLK